MDSEFKLQCKGIFWTMNRCHPYRCTHQNTGMDVRGSYRTETSLLLRRKRCYLFFSFYAYMLLLNQWPSCVGHFGVRGVRDLSPPMPATFVHSYEQIFPCFAIVGAAFSWKNFIPKRLYCCRCKMLWS